jgi:hypothetical protein
LVAVELEVLLLHKEAGQTDKIPYSAPLHQMAAAVAGKTKQQERMADLAVVVVDLVPLL